MTRMGTYDLSRLSDSSILYLRRPPRFITVFVVAVILILAGTAVWASVMVKAEELEGRGIVSSESTDITPLVSSAVTAVYRHDGDTVAAGDILFVLDSSQVAAERDGYVQLRDRYSERLSYVERMLDSLMADSEVQPFSDSGSESEFFVLFEVYLDQRSALSTDAEKNSLRQSARSTMFTERNNCSSQVDSAEKNISVLDRTLERYDVKAMCSGTVHYDANLTVGTAVSAGAKIGNVSSEGAKMVEMAVGSDLRSKIRVGDECRFTVDGLIQSEYGCVNGRVKSISSDALVSEQGAFFSVVVEFDTASLRDSSGNETAIGNGMTVNVWIIYEKTTYLKYLEEKFT